MSDDIVAPAAAMGEEPRTPAEAARALWQIDRETVRVTAALKAQRRRLPKLNKVRREAYAKAFLQAQGPEHFRRQTAELAASAASFDRDACEQEMEACKDKLWELKQRAENVRAVNSNLKEELRTLGSMP